MHLVADAPPHPFTVVELDRHRRMTALGVPAAAASRADEELPRTPEDVDRLAIGAPDDVADPGGMRRAGQAGDGVRGRLVMPMLIPDTSRVFGGAGVEFRGGDHTRVKQEALER